MASDSPTESPPGARIGLNAEDSPTPAQPTEVDLGGGPSRLANTPSDSLVSLLPSPEPIHTSRSPASVPESKSETYWNVYNEHELDTSVLSLAQTVEDARSYQTIVSTSSDLHRVATDRAVHPATLNHSRTSLRPNSRFDFLAPIRIAFFRRLYVRSGAARRSQTSLETFSTRERRFSGVITEPDSDDLERYHSHSLDRALDASDVVVDHEHGDWRSINTMSTANVIYHSMFSESYSPGTGIYW
ncbi:hypothetical protein C2E23DRAFT_470556 [Lenzites betulinus]|nr:hypothetical protein C2E23DRAFT_470556 [Lenzites betulinus]